MIKYLILMAISIFSFTMNVFGQEIIQPETNFWALRKEEVMSPLSPPARPWLLYGATATALLAFPFEDSIVDPTQAEAIEDKPLGKYSKIGDLGGQMYPNALYALGMGAHYLSTHDDSSYDRQKVMIVASAYAVSVSTLLKGIVREPRPNNKHERNSFPSGHTTSAFVFSSVVIAEHGVWPWGAAATFLAGLTAYSRITDNRHYLHDVVGGFTIGSVYGFGISEVFKKRESQRVNANLNSKPSWEFYPVYGVDNFGVLASLQF